MSYETISSFAQQAGALYFGVLFLLIVAYALWPKNKARFEAAARIPLDEEDEGTP